VKKTIPTIETKRLLLRPFTIADAKTVQQLAGEKEVAEMTLAIPHPYPDGTAEEWIATHQEQFKNGTGITCAITLKSDNSLIGAISLMSIHTEYSRAELGYWIGITYWNNGYCTEAAQKILHYAFRTLDLNRIYCTHFSGNPASGRVMRKIGMTHEGHLRQHVKKWEVFSNLEIYGIVKADWVTLNEQQQ
jgi:RimJ/RimL family protein N-acetyltransferase